MKMKLRNQRGAALVELAFSMLLLVLILFGTIEFGRVMYTRNNLNLAAREGARRASVTKDLATSTASVVSYVMTLPDTTGATVSVAMVPDPSGSGTNVNVTVSKPFTSAVPLLIPSLASLTLTGQAQMRYEY